MSKSKTYTPKYREDPVLAGYSNQRLLYEMRHEKNTAMRKTYALHIHGSYLLRKQAYRAAVCENVEEVFFSPSPPLVIPTERDRLLWRAFMKYDDIAIRKSIIYLFDDNDTRNRCLKLLDNEEKADRENIHLQLCEAMGRDCNRLNE